tara:strand:+ start:51 stop:575 length:525 start_codon:yes stop_codon:yes gene_type:complete
MSKSLYGQETERSKRRLHQGESIRHFVRYKGVIQYVVSSYKQLSDLPEKVYKALVDALGQEYIVVSGLHFVTLMQNNEYVLVRSPYEEDELRCIYGSDGNIVGRMVEVKALDLSAHSIMNARDVKITGNHRYYLEDQNKYMPVSTAGLYGHKINATNRMHAFKRNVNSGTGVIK